MLELVRTVIWQRSDEVSTEYFGLWKDDQGWQLRGTVVAALEGKPLKVRYGVICDDSWRTKSVHIALRRGGAEEPLHIAVEENGHWTVRGDAIPSTGQWVDADISITPSTNTLPIRRLALEVGQSAEVEAGWIRLPYSELQRLPQIYTRVSANLYRYESGAFSADLEVDDLGLVVQYADMWRRVARWDAELRQ